MARTRLARALLLTALCTAATMPAVAHAAPQDSRLALSIAPKNGATAPRTALLHCDPDGGTHPRAEAACDALRAAGGDFGKLTQNHASSPCTLVLKPVIATAHGTWRGKPVHFRQEFGNECQAAAKLGAAFNF